MNNSIDQRDYYARTAAHYDAMHVDNRLDEHMIALHWLSAIIHMTGAESVLDVGSGTGRAVMFLQERHPGLRVTGVEPVKELRAVAEAKGITAIIEGDATSLQFQDNTFDIVCEFGVLHHIKEDARAVREMARVARAGVFVSDSNNFAQGGKLGRLIKQTAHRLRLWPLLDHINTGGKGYHWSEGDGVFFSYSVFDSLPILKEKFSDVTLLPVRGSGPNLYRTAPHICAFASSGFAESRFNSALGFPNEPPRPIPSA